MRPLWFVTAALVASAAPARAQAPDAQMVERAHRMLEQVHEDLRRYYYDSTFGGRDRAAGYRRAGADIDGATSVPQLLGIIGQFVLDLHDSHTRFLPPGRAARVEYGWRWKMIADSCFVSWVREDSDAAKKGLATGQRVLAIDGMLPNRQTLDIINYLYYSLNPRPGMHVTVRGLDGTVREFDIQARITPRPQVVDLTSFAHISVLIEESEQRRLVRNHFTRSFGDTVLVWRFRSFVYQDERIDQIMDHARKHRALIVDLRGNGGGAVATLTRLLGHFFDRDTRVATFKRRNETEPLVIEPVRRTPFTGALFILLDSESASASEITARALQLEGKATVLGDRSAGAVMASRTWTHEVGGARQLLYGLQVTIEDVLMADGERLEDVGVTPEFIVAPSGADLSERRDPVMTKALALAGVTMDPVTAWDIFGNRDRTGR